MSQNEVVHTYFGKPCEILPASRPHIVLGYEDGRAFIREAGFPNGEKQELLAYVVAKNRIDRVTDYFFDVKTVEVSPAVVKKEETAVSIEKVSFHPYMNEMTVHIVRELPPRIGTKEARFEVEDLSGRKGIVPKAWFKKEEPKKVEDPFEYALKPVFGGGATQYYKYDTLDKAKAVLGNEKGYNYNRYVLVKKEKVRSGDGSWVIVRD